MKTGLFLALSIIISLSCSAQDVVSENINTSTNFQDANFRAAVEVIMGVSPGGEFTSDEAAAVSGELDFSSLRIQSLKGIEYFTAIESLDCSDNLITRLDVSGNPALVTLTCGDNSLSTLDVSHNPLLQRLSVSNGSDVWDRPLC